MKIVREEYLNQLIFMPRVFPVNCYLVEEEEELTLIDAAMPYSVKGIAEAVSKLDKPLTRIILTHAHDDHLGALDALKQIYPEAVIAISERDALLLAGDKTLLPGEPTTPIKGGVPRKVKSRPEQLLKEGDRMGSLEAVSAPGHTPGSMAFLDTRTGALIAGDAFQLRGGIAVSGQIRPLFPFPALATWNKEEALASARKLRKLRPTLLAVGHGALLPSPEAAMDHAIARAERALTAAKGGGRHA